MNWDLNNKHAIVFGGSKGIGRAAAIAMAERGAKITAIARSESLLKSLIAELNEINNLQNVYEVIDIMDHNLLGSKLAKISDQSTVHILINNSGGPAPGPIQNATSDNFITAFKQHIISSQIITTALIPNMKKAKYGRIINIISTSVKEPIPGLGVSNTIRGAMGNWAKTMAGELAAFGITVNNILPGFTNTGRLQTIIANKAKGADMSIEDMTKLMKSYVPIGRFANPSELGNAIAFLAMPASSYITGINLPVDGGRTKSL